MAISIACIAWTVTHEEVFREPREYFTKRSQLGKTIFERKFFYLFTCEYCFSHYVTMIFLAFSGYKLLLDDWRGYVIAGFSLFMIATVINISLTKHLSMQHLLVDCLWQIAEQTVGAMVIVVLRGFIHDAVPQNAD